MRADVRWLDGDAAVHGLYDLSFSSTWELRYHRASVLFSSCSLEEQETVLYYGGDIEKKKVAAVQTRDPAASLQYFQV